MDYTVRGILQARILKWVAFPFSRGSSQPRDQTQVSHTAGRFLTSWATRETGRRYIYVCVCVCVYIYTHKIMTDSCCCMAETNTTLSIKNLIKILMKKIAPLVFSSICPVVIFQASWVAFPILISFYLLWHYTFFENSIFHDLFSP